MPKQSHVEAVGDALRGWRPSIVSGIPALVQLIRRARIVWLIGNGGSQACAEHWATDWHKATQHRALTAYVAPAANAALLTMAANDYGYDQAYAHILAGADADRDLIIAISTSGRSSNLLQSHVDWAICPKAAPLITNATYGIVGPIYPPAVLEDVFSVLGHAIAEELRA